MRPTSLALAVCISVGVPASLQGQLCGPDEPATWWPGARFGARPTAAERASMDPHLEATEALVRKTSYGMPRGFTIRPAWTYGDKPDARMLRQFGFAAVVFLECNRFDEHGSDFTVEFNPRPREWTANSLPDENDDTLYVEFPHSEPLHGAIATFGHLEEPNGIGLRILFSSTGEPPMLPVTREEYLRAVILSIEGKNQATLKATLAHLATTDYERWLEDAPVRKRGNDEILRGVATVDPSKVAQVRADLEKVERESEAMHRKNDAAQRVERDKMIAAIRAPGDRIRAQIAAMTPADRAVPAWITDLTELVAPGTPQAHAIVRRNPDFFRPRTSQTEVRLMLVVVPNAWPEMRERHLQMYREFDWAALKRQLR